MNLKDVCKDSLHYQISAVEAKFIEDFIDSFVDGNYEYCAYLFRDYLKSCDSYTSIDVHYDFERELFL